MTGHDPYNSTATPPVRMRADDPLVSQIRAALDARKLGYSSERTLELMRARGFGIEALTDARHAPESVRRELEAAYQRADTDYRRAFFGMKRRGA